MPCSSLAFVWTTETGHQVFLQTGYHVLLRHASAVYMHADLAINVQRYLNACRDSYLYVEIAKYAPGSSFCAESVRYNIFANGAPYAFSVKGKNLEPERDCTLLCVHLW